MNTTQISRYISLILRHKPEEIHISLDPYGWADVQELINGIRNTKHIPFDFELLQHIVKTDEKQRYSFNDTKTKIRANQGHSIPVQVELTTETPPDTLYHGTAEKYTSSIETKGLLPKSRLYVHLSATKDVAYQVGKRHGNPVIYKINTKQMHQDGYEFFLSANHVWLTKEVPTRYLKRIS